MSGSIALRPTTLAGNTEAPPSKSCAHRALIAAALARGRSRLSNVELSQDIAATIGAVRALGARVEAGDTPSDRTALSVYGIESPAESPVIDCGESGSTLRFMLPVALAACGQAEFRGAPGLGRRPIGPYLDIFRTQGIVFERGEAGFPLAVRGALRPGAFSLPGNVSSQFVTGLLLALALLPGDSAVCVEGVLESQPYVDVTTDVMRRFGVDVEEAERGSLYRVTPQEYRAADYAVEGDWSQAAFLLLMGLAGGEVSVGGLDGGSRQGDRVIVDIFRGMGGDIRWEGDRITARKSKLHAVETDVSQCPDLAPAVAAAMALAGGESRIAGGARLRAKESDRLRSIETCLNALGADAEAADDGLRIRGRPALRGGRAQSFNDHRIAMMAAAVAPACTGPVALEGWEAVAKSWPGFWETYRGLGGMADGQ